MIKKAANALTGWLTVILILTAANYFQTSAAVYRKCAENKVSVEPNLRYASDNDSIKLALLNGKLVSLNKRKLIYLWEADLGGKIVSDVFEKNGFVYVVSQITNVPKNTDSSTADTNILWMIDEKTGLMIKKMLLDSSQNYYFLDYGALFILVNSTGKVSIHQNNLVAVKEMNTKLPIINQPVLLDRVLYLPEINSIHSVDLDNLTVSVLVERSDAISQLGVFKKTGLLIGDRLGNLSFYDRNKKRFVWKFRTGGQITSLTVSSSAILTASVDGFIYSLNNKGGLRWKRRLKERISGELLLTGNSLMFGLADEENLMVISLKDGSEEDRLEIAGRPYLMTSTGFDANQFVVFSDGKILIYSTAGCA